MKKLVFSLLLFMAFFTALAQNGPITLVIHGGAGTIRRANMTPEKEQAIRAKLDEALQKGYEVLEKGGTSLMAITTAIQILEASEYFNAGRGAVFTHEGKNELDASIMDGSTRNAGAVTGVSTIKSPILAALAVMQKSPHVMLSGAGAESFAAQQGLEIVSPDYFYTESRYKTLQRIKKREAENKKQGSVSYEYPDYKYGTVGAVALDQYGNLAAGTSTGGMTNKRYGRIGDAPIIGAGTFADNATCAVSATGHGEYFMRWVAAYDIAAQMQYGQKSLEQAAENTVMKTLKEKGGAGGVIALDAQGNYAMPFNTPGMYRGVIQNKQALVFIYNDEGQ